MKIKIQNFTKLGFDIDKYKKNITNMSIIKINIMSCSNMIDPKINNIKAKPAMILPNIK